MRDVVGQSVAKIDVPGLKQEFDRVRADRANRIAVELPREREPAGRYAARDIAKNLGRARDAPPLLIALEPADILVPETVCGDFMTLGAERAHQIAMDMRDDRRDREGRPHTVLAESLAQRREPLIGAQNRL